MRRRLLVLPVLAALLVGGCTGDRAPRTGGAEVVATGLEVPWGLTFLPSGEALVGERTTGRILLLPADGGEPEHVATLPEVVADGEGGLLGLAVSPQFVHDSFVYAYLTAEEDNRVVRFRLSPDGTEPYDYQVLVEGIARAGFHDGGGLAFGPDGLLYAGTGDAGDRPAAQDPTSLNGKILRMTATGVPAPDNPDPSSYVFSLGHRNVQGLAWDSRGRLWATEFGQDTWDEVNLIRAGGNYGWPIVEGVAGDTSGRFVDPQVTWRPDEASPSGAAVAPGTDGGDVLYVGALRGERLWRIPITADGLGEPQALLEQEFGRLRTVRLGPDGALWLTTSNRDGRGDPARGDDLVLRYSLPDGS